MIRLSGFLIGPHRFSAHGLLELKRISSLPVIDSVAERKIDYGRENV